MSDVRVPDLTGSWPTGLPRSLDYPECGADAILAGAARSYPNRVALRDGDTTLTFAELHDRALRVAGSLRIRGIEPEDAVALHMPNSLWYVVAYYGALCSGAAVAPINPAQPAAELRRQLDDCAAKVVFTHPSCAATALAAQMESECERTLVVIPATAAGPAGSEVTTTGLVPLAELLDAEPLTNYRVDPDLVAHLQLTGGTTGRSKAVRVLHRNLVANVVQTTSWRTGHAATLDDGAITLTPIAGAQTPHMLVPGASVSIAVAPLFHGLGLVSHNFATLMGGTAILSGRFDPDTFLDDVDRHRVTYLAGSPTMYYAILRARTLREHDLTSVRYIGSGAAPLDTTAIRTLREVFPRAMVTEGYGLSEATMAVTMHAASPAVDTPLGSVGIPIFDTEIEIRDDDGSTLLPVGRAGQIWARGPQITDGYQGEPELTARQFIGGWLHTGDMGRIDDYGHLFIVGRTKDLIIYKGYNVYPQPLEELVCTHPAVAQAAVVGAPSETAGEIPVAFVVLRPGVRSSAEITDSIIGHVAAEVAPYQRVRAVHVLDALPATATGKIRKADLRESLGA
ncbi:class I adenylate-forming enzyme family protein [Rhodococcus wratislaviensis]|uniref:class I adenylate-forming enzyme family protein n=1 Tax=Rhodococcus wratislaviensis TaxID=44752 RepID=UPI003512391C